MSSIIKVESDLSLDKQEAVTEKRGRTYVQWLFATLASTTLMTYGLLAGWTSPMTKVLQSDQSPTGAALTDSELSWVGSSLALIATFGVGLYTYIADVYGRKMGIIAIAIPQALCWTIKLFAKNTTVLLIARLCGGIPAGGCFNLVPMYVKEISQDSIRGSVVSMTLLMQNFGLLVMYAMGSYLGYYTVLYIVLTLSVLTTTMMFFAPESPAFLVKKGKFEEAAKTTALLRSLDVNDKIVQAEVESMKKEEIHYSTLPQIKFLNIFKNKAWRRGYLFIMLLISTQAFNGAFSIVTYAWTIISSSGVTVNPELQSLIVPILMILGSLFSMALVERVGRKTLLASTFMLSVVAALTLATTLLIQSRGGYFPSWLPVVAIAASVWSYSAGITPMIYVIMAEMFNFQVRAKLIGCIITYAWLISSSQAAVFGPLSRLIGMHNTFYIFAVTNFLGCVVALIIPETKGKTIPEIEQMLVGKK